MFIILIKSSNLVAIVSCLYYIGSLGFLNHKGGLGADLEGQHSAGQVSSLDLRNVGGQHLVSVGPLSVQSVGLSWTRPAGPTSSLFSLSLRNNQTR